MECDRQRVQPLRADVPLIARRFDAVSLAGIVLAMGAFLLLALSQDGLQQDDPYHLALAEMLRDGARPTTLPWAKYTVLADRFADMHFGYHVSMAPFIAILPARTAGVLANALGVLALLLAVAGIVGREHPLRGVLPAVVLVASGDFLLRVMGMRPIAWGAAAVLLVIPLASARKHAWLAVLGFAFAFSYAAFSLLLLPLAAHGLGELVSTGERVWRPTAFTGLGVFAGVLVHPDFPAYLDVLEIQLFRVSAGAYNLEYASPGVATFFSQGGLALLLAVIGAAATVRAPPERRREALPWALLTCATLLLFVRYHRGVDTFAPVAVTFAAVATRAWVVPRRLVSALAVATLCVAAVHGQYAWSASRGFEARDVRAAATFLARNSEAGDHVFLADYGAFPRLFHANRRNAYTLGLEPAFMRARDPDLFARYVASVRLEADPYPLIAETMGARYVFVENTASSRPFYSHLRLSASRYTLVYQDRAASVFAVRRREGVLR